MPDAPADPPPDHEPRPGGAARSATGVLTLTGPQDLLAALPYRLGFHPQRSLVLLELSPTPGRADGGVRHALGACVRADLPIELADVMAVAQAAVGPWQRAQAAGPVVLVVYDDTEPSLGEGVGRSLVTVLLRSVEERLAQAGIVVHDIFAVGPRQWRSLRYPTGASGDGGDEAGGRSVAELASGAVAAEAVLRGLVAAPSREHLSAPSAPLSEARLRQARRALTRAQRAPWTPGRRRAGLQLWAAVRSCYESEPAEGQPGDLPSAEVSGRLLAALTDLAVRDAVLLDAVPGAAARAAAAGLLAGSAASALGDRLVQALATPPDRRRAEAGARLAVDLARHVDPGLAGRVGEAGTFERGAAAGALAVAAWTWWSAGDGVRAGGCAAEALRHEEGHSLAGLVARAVEQGLPPSWQQASGASRRQGGAGAGDEVGVRV